MRRESHKILM